MPKGFDTTSDCSDKAAEIREAGYDFVARYLSKSSSKMITPDEAQELSDKGLAIVLVYEDGPTGADYFSNARGQVDAARAAQQANALGAPDGTTIYFAVDYDASGDDHSGVISEYFQGVNSGLSTFAAAGNPRYRVGIYGSGASCIAITNAGLATHGWLAQATGWRGHGAYTSWSISQGMPGHVLGLSVDPDTAVGDYGAVPAPAAIA
jgi:Rv2525c-like, glycoside hydrolase-like domain